MGVLDKFLDVMKLNDDEEYEDDDFFDDEYEDEPEDDYEEVKPKRSNPFKKEKPAYEEEYEPEAKKPRQNKITPMRQPSGRKSAASMEVCVIRPNTHDDSREITDTLLSGRTVILNLEGIDVDVAQRIIDFTSGSAYAIDGNLQKISNYIFLVTPANVDISGDLQDLLGATAGSSFDVPQF